MVRPSLLFAIVLLALCEIIVSNDQPIVKTSLGDLRGVLKGKGVRAFLGVPYALPPVEHRRFKVSEIWKEQWDGIRDAQTMASSCYQTPDETYPGFYGSEMWNSPTKLSEDCLNMNIWVPEKPTGDVLVWIFGGGFFSGSPSLSVYDGTVLAETTSAIIVNINYRLGPFGFLYLGDQSPVPGNMGLLDQQTALQWISQHIASFGGNPSRVTLMGESAGAASVTSHLLAPGSSKYFNKIIANSGSITHPWATMDPRAMYETSMKLAKALNCGKSDAVSIQECLSALPAEKIQEQNNVITGEWPHVLFFPFVPIRTDNNFFKGNLFEHLRTGKMKKDVSVIIGAVKDEGTFWLPYYFYKSGFVFNHTKDADSRENASPLDEAQYEASIDSLMPYFGNSPAAKQILLSSYKTTWTEKEESLRLRDGVAQLVGELFFTCSVKEFSDFLVDNAEAVYSYYFTKRSSANPWPEWMGVMHGYEIEYEFGQPFANASLYDQNQLSEEQKVSEYVMGLIGNFVSTGIPAHYWPKYDTTEKKSLEINSETANGSHKIIKDFHGSSCAAIASAKQAAATRSSRYGRSPLSWTESLVLSKTAAVKP